jgi:hypothetical protein
VKANGTTRRHHPDDVVLRLAASLLLTAALVGCGGGGNGGPPPPSGNPVPSLTSISPTSAPVGSAEFTLTATGSKFISSSVVRWNGSNRTTTFVSATQLTATIPASDLATAAAAQVTVFNPSPGGGTSTARTFNVENPAPTLNSISPTSATAGGAVFTLTVDGSNFVSGSVVRWNGNSRTTTFVSATQLTASIPASDIASGGTAQVTVFNPTPGGGTTTALTFTTENPVPTLRLLTPNSAVAGTTGFTLRLDGSGFVPASVVQWNGVNRTTTFASGSRLTTAIAANDIATPGTAQVTVFNPTPNGGTSNPLTFTIEASQPLAISTTSLPASAGGKTYDFTLGTRGGVPPVTWNLAAGSPPTGLTLDATGRISGTIGGGSSSFTVQATDSSVPPGTGSRLLSITVRAGALGGNNTCSPGTTVGTTAISNGRIRASISPYGDIDVYSFHGTASAQVTIEIFAQRLDLDGDPNTRDSQLDSVIQLLSSGCSQLTFNDDIDPGIIQDSLISNFTLPSTGTYFIVVRDFRGDGRPDLIYELSLSGAD